MVDESLAPEKLCTILFGAGRLKITLKHHVACCMSQDYTFTQATRTHAPQNLRPQTGVCIQHRKENEHGVEKNF